MADNHFTPAEKLQEAIANSDSLIATIDHKEQITSEINESEFEKLKQALLLPKFPELLPSHKGGKVTNTEAREIVRILKDWADKDLPNNSIYGAAKDLEALFVRVWTEIDEALCALSSFKRVLEKRAPDVLVARPEDSCYVYEDGRRVTGLDTAMLYLNRWQDRGGAMGNIAHTSKAIHPINELSETKLRLRDLVRSYANLTSEAEAAGDKVIDLLCIALDILPEEMRQQRLLISNAIDTLSSLNAYIYDENRQVDEYFPDNQDANSIAA